MARSIEELRAIGTAVWLDDLSRPRIVSGGLSAMVGRGDIVSITTNPTIFAKAIGSGLASSRWKALAATGARPQRLLWASTGVKDKGADDTRYVVELAAPDTVNTMPEATLNAVVNHGSIRGDTVRNTFAVSRETLERLAARGMEIADVPDHLETQGLASFAKSWDELVASVTDQIEKARAVGPTAPPGGTL